MIFVHIYNKNDVTTRQQHKHKSNAKQTINCRKSRLFLSFLNYMAIILLECSNKVQKKISVVKEDTQNMTR